MADDEEIEALVVAAAAHDKGAWQQLWAAIEPPLSKIIAQPRFLGRLGQREDDRRNIVMKVMERLAHQDFHRLRLYLEARESNPRLRFMGWLRVVAKRVGIDYMRAHPDYVRTADAPAWVDPKTLPPESQLPGGRPPVTVMNTANRLLDFARNVLPREQYQALEMWTHDAGFDAIAKDLGLGDAREAERMVRAVRERLRREFRES
jgi:hypothetical protein